MSFRSVLVALGAALLGALLLAAPAAQAKTTHAKAIVYAGIDCYATLPVEGRGIVCSSDSLPDTGELDPYVGLKPTGSSKLGQRGDYGGYYVRAPTRLKLHDRWVWHGITCTAGKDGLSCLNRERKGFNIGPAGYSPLGGASRVTTLRSHSILTPDGKISCYLSMPADGGGIYCNSPGLGKRRGMPRYAALKRTGATRIVARSDYGGYSDRPRTIRRGDRWIVGGVSCSLGSMGLNCNNADDHGFLMDNRSLTRH